ncbi:MAG: lantibiotic dehydratase family protein [Bacteroidales bacterium]|nr:lantibiotic dehydratase family protein [Bacteroidales bacterium]
MKYQSFESFILRTPAYAFSFYKKIQNLDWEEIIELFKDPYIRESIYLASPILHGKLTHFDSDKLEQKEKTRILFSFFKYLIRLSTKPIPFGLFAGSSCSNDWGNNTKYKIKGTESFHKKIKLTCQTIELIINKIEESLICPNKLIYYTNNTLYQLPFGDYRYIRIKYGSSGKSSDIINLQGSEFLDKVIRLASNGITSEELFNTLIKEPEIKEEAAVGFIKSLIKSQILISDIKLKLVTNDNLNDLLESVKEYKLERFTHDTSFITELNKLSGFKQDLTSLLNVEDKMNKMLNGFNEKRFHADLFIKPEINTLNKSVINDVLPKAFKVLSRLVSVNSTPIVTFKEKMIERYGNKEIRLVDALDPVIGVGYNENRNLSRKESLFEGINWSSNTSDVVLSSIDQFLIKKITKAPLINNIECQLTDNDLAQLTERKYLLPDTFSVFLSVLDSQNEKYLFKVASSITAAGHISRFSHLDTEIDNLLKSIFEHEKQIEENSIVAEVIHLPTQEIGNVILRTSTREYEIPYLSKHSNNSNHININDLLVSVDSNNDLILRSKTLNKRIIPKISTGYNYMMTEFPIFRFLCDLQSGKDHLTGMEFMWGDYFSTFSFLPRISYQNIVFSPAQWRFKENDLQILLNILNNLSDKKQIEDFIKEKHIPRYILFSENESDLMLDLESDNSLNLLKSLIKGKKEILLKESLFSETNPMIQEYDYVNEYIIPIKKKHEQ